MKNEREKRKEQQKQKQSLNRLEEMTLNKGWFSFSENRTVIAHIESHAFWNADILDRQTFRSACISDN